MRYSLTFLQEHYDVLVGALFPSPTERAAYLLCGLAVGSDETRLLVREVIPIPDADVTSASAAHISIPVTTYVKWLKRADETKQCLVFVHSHPEGYLKFSPQDDSEEPDFFRTAYTRIKKTGMHASIVLTDPSHIIGRVWLPDGSHVPLECIRILGRRFRFVRDYAGADPQEAFFDRQIRAFGQEFQPVLRALHVAVVGAGGTGSAICEQLIRLGIGSVTVIDGGEFEVSNIGRVYGSLATDDGINKPNIVKRLANSVGVGTAVTTIYKPITFKSAFRYLKDCDVVFGCTDDQVGRSLLSAFARYYLTPVFDMGVAINPNEDGSIERIEGRVTTLLAGTACLYCRNRISPQGVRAESIHELDPAQAAALRREGYLLGVQEHAPSVIPFTTAIASVAISELLHRLTGFMGDDRVTSEVIYRMDWNRIRTNCTPPEPGCVCSNRAKWGVGDTRPLLDVTWRPEQ